MNIVITGSSRGIGRAIALRLAAPGNRILINYLRNQAAADAVANEVRAAGAEAIVVQGNVRKEEDLKRLAAGFDSVDVLIHNAAIGALKPYDRIRTSHWDLTLESSMRPFWLLTKLTSLADGAVMIGLSSMGSQRYIPGYAAMGAAKAGIGIDAAVGGRVGSRGIRVNTVCGGLIRTDAIQYFPEGEEMLDLADRLTPLGRVGELEDLAGAMAMLLVRMPMDNGSGDRGG